MRKALATLVFLFIAVSAFGSKSMQLPASDPKADAQRAYNDGLRYRDRAWNAEKELKTTTDPKRRATLEEVIAKSYKADARQQTQAIRLDSSLYQAQTELGYALRKTGDYQGSLAAYDKALEMMPGYAEAVEYRGEAYLALNRVDDAKAAYLLLFNGGDKDRSRLLGEAMQSWIAARKTDPAGVAPDALAKFTQWVGERKEIAANAGTASGGGSWK